MSALRRLVVIDPVLNDLAGLLASLMNQPLVDILQLSPSQDALTQISSQLASQSYGALDIFSPGAAGSISLNGQTLDANTLASHASTLTQIGAQLQGGAIFLYGSQVASGAAGQTFINTLAIDTGVAVVASTGLSGSSSATSGTGVDWVLEASSQTAPITIPSLLPVHYGGVLGINDAPAALIPAGDWTQASIKTISTPGHASDQLTFVDVNGDGNLDLVSVAVVGADAGKPANWQHVVTIATGNGSGGFNTAVNVTLPAQLTQIRLADTNADGRADVVATGWSDWNQPILSVQHGNAQAGLDGAVNTLLSVLPDTLAVQDLNGDGRPDVVLGGTNLQTTNYTLQVLPNDAHGGFAAAITLPVSGFHATNIPVGDVNGDGRVEIIALGDDYQTGNRSVKIIGNDGAGHYSLLGSVTIPDAAHSNGLMVVADINGDGRADLVLPGMDPMSGAATVTVLPGNTAGSFDTPVLSTFAPASHSFWSSALTSGDLNADGRADLVLGGFDSSTGKPATYLLSGHVDGSLTVVSETLQSAQTDGISAVAVGDINHDGQLEIGVAGSSLSASGTTQQFSIETAATVAAVANEDTVQSIILRGSDVDGNIDHFNVTTLPAHSGLYLDAALTQAVTVITNVTATQGSATLYFKPDANWNGATSLAFVAVDNLNAMSSPATLPITVNAVNDLPVAMSPLSGQASSLFTVQQYLGYQSNSLQNLVNYASSHAPDYTVQTNVVHYSEAGWGGSSLGSTNIWPAAVAQNYFALGGIDNNFFTRATATFSVGTTDTYTFQDTSDDGSFLLIDGQLVVNDPVYHGLTAVTGSITLAPGNHTLEQYFFQGTGSATLDLSVKSSIGSFQLAGVTGGLLMPATATTPGNTPLSLVLQGSDVDGTIASFKLSSLPTHGVLYSDAALTQVIGADTVINARIDNATIYFKPDTNWTGNTSLSFVAVDNLGAVSSNSVTLPISVTQVNSPPTLAGTPVSSAGDEDTVQTIVLHGTDADGNIDHFNLAAAPAHGTLYLDSALTKALTSTSIPATQNSATLYFKPDANWNGNTSLTVSAVDNLNATSNLAMLQISVNSVNDAPVASSMFSGLDSNFFTVQQYLGHQSNSLPDLLSYAASHVASYTVQANVIDYSDTGSGGLLGGSNYWPAALAQGYFVSNGINDNFFAHVTASFSVSSADTYTFRAITDDGSFVLVDGQLVINDPTYHAQTAMTGSITLSPGNHVLEQYFFENGGGAISELSVKSSTGVYQLVGTAGGLLTPATTATPEDSPVSLLLQGGDVDGMVTSFKLSALPAHGTTYSDAALTHAIGANTVISALNNTATIYFKPDANWNGSTSLSFAAVDDLGAVSSNIVTLPITVTAVNDPPALSAASAILATGKQNATYLLSSSDLLQGWTDVEGNALSVANLATTHGTLADNHNGTWIFTPDANYSGAVGLTYYVIDGQGGISAATQSFSLAAVNRPPALTGTAATLAHGTQNAATTINTSDLLAGWIDPDAGTTLSVVNLTASNGGVITANANGSYTLTMPTNTFGAVSLSYGVSDGLIASAATEALTIDHVNQPPALTSAAALLPAGIQNQPFTVAATSLLQGWSDPDAGAALSVSGLVADHGTVLDKLNGSWTVTPTAGYSGPLSLNYAVLDGQGASSAAVETLTLAAALTVTAAVTTTLVATAQNLTLTGTAAINGTGNAYFNVITGNSGANILDGGAGADTLIGAAGNDTYIVDNALDVITETATGGTDTVNASVSYILPVNVENLTLTGTALINATGNALANTLTGNAADNILDGGAGADKLVGGLGNDTYVVDIATDTVTEAAGAGTDTVQASITYTLGTNVENLTLTGSTAINGTGNTLNNVLTGNSADNVLSGGTGADTMVGGLGNDTYVVDNAGDVVTENINEGTDLVQASVTCTLLANIENLTLTGTTAINGTGNDLANTITGNTGANVLDGGLGADTLIGGAGNDTYVVDNALDLITETATGGTDTVNASVSYTLAVNVENLTLTGTAAINANGNAVANTLIGNAGNNVISAGLGLDKLTGGAGNDQFVFNTAAATTNIDTITDFVSGVDLIVLDASVFTGTGLHNTALSAGMLHAGAGFTSAALATDHLIFDTSTGKLYYDADGAGGVAALQIATLTGVTSLKASDIFIL